MRGKMVGTELAPMIEDINEYHRLLIDLKVLICWGCPDSSVNRFGIFYPRISLFSITGFGRRESRDQLILYLTFGNEKASTAS
jgi:hypothetical protein